MADPREGAGKHAEPVPDARWTAMAHRRRALVIDSDVDLKTITWALWEEHQFRCRKSAEPKPRKEPSYATPTTDHETRRPGPGIARSQRDRAQNPVNTTRTCNKLRQVYREVM